MGQVGHREGVCGSGEVRGSPPQECLREQILSSLGSSIYAKEQSGCLEVQTATAVDSWPGWRFLKMGGRIISALSSPDRYRCLSLSIVTVKEVLSGQSNVPSIPHHKDTSSNDESRGAGWSSGTDAFVSPPSEEQVATQPPRTRRSTPEAPPTTQQLVTLWLTLFSGLRSPQARFGILQEIKLV